MQLVEQHVIKRNHPAWSEIDAAAFAAKNLYNATNYLVREAFFNDGTYLSYYDTYKLMKSHETYKALPARSGCEVLRMLDKAWKSFFRASKSYGKNPGLFKGRPKPPHYLKKDTGRYVVIYDTGTMSEVSLRQGFIKPSRMEHCFPTRKTNVDQARFVPRGDHYVLEVVHTVEPVQADVDPGLVAGIDIGLNNLACLVSNKPGFVPILINGRPLKWLNQGYNKRIADLQSKLGTTGRTKRMNRITVRRNRQIKHYLHTHSKRIIDILIEEGIGTLVIGKNDGWKQSINLGRRTNQNFVQVPHAQFIDMLRYKAELVGIGTIVVEESHTSKCSFFDGEEICHHDSYVGKRVSRGMFRTADGVLINADVNGAYNIIAKAIPEAFGIGGSGCVAHPVGTMPTH